MQFVIVGATTSRLEQVLKSAQYLASIIVVMLRTFVLLYSLNTLDDESLVTTEFRSPWKPVRRPRATHL